MRLDRIVAGATLLGASALFIVACAGQPGSVNPLGASGIGTSVQALEAGGGSCSDGIDNDDNKKTDCADPGCAEDPACKNGGGGPACSPGWWKKHVDEFNATCTQVSGWTCADLWTAITCKGSEDGCTGTRRQAAASALNAIDGCTE